MFIFGRRGRTGRASSNRGRVVDRNVCVTMCERLSGDRASEAGEMSEAGEASGVSEASETMRWRCDGDDYG